MLTILALHYWAGSGREYQGLRAALPAGTQLLSPDLPGFGAQAAPAGFDFSVAHYATWLAEFAAKHKLLNYCVIGHSMSGKMALALAARRPAGLRRLVLLAPSPPTPEPMTAAARAAALAAFGQPAEAEKTFQRITQRPLLAAQRNLVVADNLRTSRAGWDAWLQGGMRENISALLPALEVPCAVLVGGCDRAITLATQRRHTLPWLPAGTVLHEAPGAGHLLPLEASAAVAALVLAASE